MSCSALFPLGDGARISTGGPVVWEMSIGRLWPELGGSPEAVLLRDSFRFKAKFTICKESLSKPGCGLSASFVPLGPLDELVDACAYGVGVGVCCAVVEPEAIAAGPDSDAEFLCRLHGKRDRFLRTTTSVSGAFRFSAEASEGRGRCDVTLELAERGRESSKKPPELGPLRCPGVLRSPSRELFPNVLPSSSPLARPSLTGLAAHRGVPSSDRFKGDRMPVEGGRCCSSKGDIESHARVVR